MMNEVARDPSRPIKRIYNEVLIQHSHTVDDDDIPEFSRVRSKLSRKRMSLLPPIPRIVDDVIIEVNGQKHGVDRSS